MRLECYTKNSVTPRSDGVFGHGGTVIAYILAPPNCALGSKTPIPPMDTLWTKAGAMTKSGPAESNVRDNLQIIDALGVGWASNPSWHATTNANGPVDLAQPSVYIPTHSLH